jgi:hypothetical protein
MYILIILLENLNESLRDSEFNVQSLMLVVQLVTVLDVFFLINTIHRYSARSFNVTILLTTITLLFDMNAENVVMYITFSLAPQIAVTRLKTFQFF